MNLEYENLFVKICNLNKIKQSAASKRQTSKSQFEIYIIIIQKNL